MKKGRPSTASTGLKTAMSIVLASAGAGTAINAAAQEQDAETVALPAVEVEDSVLAPVAASSLKQVFNDRPEIGISAPTTATQKLFVNGIEENNLNVQVDGARQSNNIWHHNGSTLIDPQILKAVTVDAGVAPADAGPGALGGSVRYETRDVADLLGEGRKGGAFVGLGYESNAQTFSQSGAAYGRSGALEALGYVSHGEGKNYEDGGGNEVRGTAVNSLSTLGKLAYTGDGGGRVELSGQYLSDDDIRPYRANFADVRGTGLYAPNDFSRKSGTLEYTSTKKTASFDPLVRFYFNDTSIKRPSPTGGARPGYFDSSILGIGGVAQNGFATSFGQLIAGVDFYKDKSDTDNFAAPKFKETATNLGTFTQLRTDETKPLSASLGLRFDSQKYESVDGKDLDNSGLSPNVSLRYAFIPSLALTAGYSYVFGGLALAESALFHASPYSYPDDLDAQRARNGKVGLEYRAGGVLLGAEGFNTLIKNAADFDFSFNNEEGPYPRIAGPDLKTRGYHLNAAYAWANARIGAHYTHADLEYGDNRVGTRSYTFGTPVGDILKLNAAYAWPAVGLSSGVDAVIVSDYDADDDSATPDLKGYEVLNAHLEWRPVSLPQLSLNLAVNNLLDKDYVDRFTSGVEIPAVISPLHDIGRSFLLSTRFTF